ncbi:GDSL-type esterase/lipase family protein [Rhizobium bangladeshense]|uniref:GDSL-type esterase/lipase family protein n=1 Tax=Rhizobium bangladeshense TaxID=1138189 RepID=UPI001C836683|nr:GDSL-type esterase/lipase family protein [Rhizobium bangladeshense]MBX4898473.1 lipase [Rhizobium bangladeshense]MBX4902864.1 lipase [Rhizobium bangladeshense]MBX4914674.1 lipase [Rhizobium bangladeshense]MBY3616497.1 lipase [Rhizobium bangladeshense]
MLRLFTKFAITLIFNFFLIIGAAGPSFGQECPEPATAANVSVQQKPASKRYDRALPIYRDKSARYDMALIGDSLVEQWQPLIADSFPGRHVMNLAVAGDTTQNALYRLDELNLPGFRPADVVVLIGTNNLGAKSAPCAVAAGVVAVVSKIRALWPAAHIYSLSIPPRGKKYASYEDIRISTNRLVASSLAGMPDVTFIQLTDDMLRCGKPSDKECSNYKPDHLHFNEGAYKLITSFLTSAGLRL